MKNKVIISLLSLTTLALTGCDFLRDFIIIDRDSVQGDDSTPTSNKPTTSNTDDTTVDSSKDGTTEAKDTTVARSVLTITRAPKTDYYKYDTLDLSNLVVYQQRLNKSDEIISSVKSTQYTLKYEGESTPLDKTAMLKDVGSKTIVISKDGFESTSFDITIHNVTNLKQTLSVTANPTKTMYQENEIFDRSGLVVQLKTEYTSTTNKFFSQVITDYNIRIGNAVETKPLTVIGSNRVNISYTTEEGNNVSTFFEIKVFSNTYAPVEYDDSTIVREQDNASATITISGKSANATGDKGYYSPSEVINKYNIKSYSGRNAAGATYIPSTGKVPLLVIPIVTPGDDAKATQQNWELIQKAFFGNSEDLNFESLHSYYYQASNGKLDFTGAVTPFYNPKDDPNDTGNFDTLSSYTVTSSNSDVTITSNLAKQAAAWAVSTLNLNLSDYDTNNDGFVDALWMVNLHKMDSSTVFWPFQTQVYHSTLNYHPAAGTTEIAAFGWANLDAINDMGFKYKAPSHVFDNQDCDAHVIIHETGHLLGLSDYYSYSYNNDYGPMGQNDMMDNNVGDHNSYSKLLLGWVNPYIVYGNATINLQSAQENGGVIVIPYDGKTYKQDASGKKLFNAYDEYMVIDLFTNKNLNKQGYDCYNVSALTTSGMKVLHVDNRIFDYNALSSFSGTCRFSLASDIDKIFSSPSTGHYPYSVITNTEGANPQNGNDTSEYNYLNNHDFDAFDEVRWIRADNKIMDVGDNCATNAALFKPSLNPTFSLSRCKTQFVNNKLDNGQPFSAIVQITSLS